MLVLLVCQWYPSACMMGLLHAWQSQNGNGMHAGMKGGSVQNPIHALASFISDLHTPDGSVAVEGFYECAPYPHK